MDIHPGTNTMSRGPPSLHAAARRDPQRGRDHAAAARSSLSAPRMTILSASSGSGRCSDFASSHGARSHTSHSSLVVKITGIALGWIGSTTAFGAVVRKPWT